MFKRKIPLVIWPLVWLKYKKLVNANNISSLSRVRLYKIFENESEDIRSIYLHNVIRKWVEINNDESRLFLNSLKKIVKKSAITVSDQDAHDLLRLEERIFVQERSFKNLDSNYPTEHGEKVFIRYRKAKLFGFQKGLYKELQKGTLLISDKKFVIEAQELEMVFEHIKITWYKFTSYGFEFKFNKKIFLIRIHDSITLNKTIESLYLKKVKYMREKNKTTN